MNSGNEPIWIEAKAMSGKPESSASESGMPGANRHSSALRPSTPHRPGLKPPAPKGISYWRVAWGHKFLLVGFILLGAMVGTVRVTLQTPVYGASSTVELVGFNQSFLGMNLVDPQAGTDAASASPSNMQTQMRILTSRTLLSRVIERMNLELTPQVSVPVTVFTRLRNRVPFLQQDPIVQSRQALGMAASTVSAKQIGLTRLIEISCSSSSPEVAANFVNTLASEHVQQTQAARSNVTQQTSQWMDSQLEEARSRLQQADQKLHDFVQKSGMDFFADQATLADTKMGSLRLNVSAIQSDRIGKQALWELAQKTPTENLPDVMNDATLQNLRGQILALRRDMALLTATLTPENPKVKKIQSQIAELEKDLDREKVSLLKRVKSDYDEAVKREKMLTAAYDAQTHSVSAQADKSAQYALLKREVDTDQQLYNSLLQQSSQAALMALAPSNSIRVVDTAFPSHRPFSPNPGKDIPVSSVAGGVLGYGLLLLIEMARRKRLEKLFDTPGHAQAVLGVPELGVIPSTLVTPPGRKFIPPVPWRRSQSGEPAKVLDLSTDKTGIKTNGSGAVYGNQSAMLSESFRQTLVSLLRTKPRDHNPVYVISSAGPAEGKTVLSANLARAMAETGQRVLLVDADLRRPHVHTLLAMKNHSGLSDILAGDVEIRDLALDSYVQPSQIANLSVMTHGLAESENPLFFSSRVPELVALLRSRFDCVLFDTAPALPFPDARLWGKHSDGVVLVVRSGITTREGASAACERFLSDGIPVLGTILNDWTPQPGSDLPYYYYGKYQSTGPKVV